MIYVKFAEDTRADSERKADIFFKWQKQYFMSKYVISRFGLAGCEKKGQTLVQLIHNLQQWIFGICSFLTSTTIHAHICTFDWSFRGLPNAEEWKRSTFSAFLPSSSFQLSEISVINFYLFVHFHIPLNSNSMIVLFLTLAEESVEWHKKEEIFFCVELFRTVREKIESGKVIRDRDTGGVKTIHFLKKKTLLLISFNFLITMNNSTAS